MITIVSGSVTKTVYPVFRPELSKNGLANLGRRERDISYNVSSFLFLEKWGPLQPGVFRSKAKNLAGSVTVLLTIDSEP